MIHGSYWNATHNAVAIAWAAQMGVKLTVISKGDEFYNRDHFSLLFLLLGLTEWSAENPGATPTYTQLLGLIHKAENYKLPGDGVPHICIASTPPLLTHQESRELDGGLAHEVFHTIFTHRGKVDMDEVWRILQEHWDPEHNYGTGVGFLKSLWNCVEDGRIERRGCTRWEGAEGLLRDIEARMLSLEAEGREAGGWPLSSHLRAAVRDHIRGFHEKDDKHWERYLPEANELCASVFAEEIAFATADLEEPLTSYRSFECAFRLFAMFDKLNLVERDPKPEPKEGDTTPQTIIIISEEALENQGGPGRVLGPGAAVVVITRQVIERGRANGKLYPRPWRTDLDEENFISEITPVGAEALQRDLGNVTQAAGFIRSRLFALLRARKTTKRRHGVAKGYDLSDRRLVALRTDPLTTLPFVKKIPGTKINTAASILLDESSSVAYSGLTSLFRQTILALAEPMSTLQIPLEVIGVRARQELGQKYGTPKDPENYTRVQPVIYDIFKTFNDPWFVARDRLGETISRGSTPLTAGFEYTVRRLVFRPEDRKIVFLITDGDPNGCLTHVAYQQWEKYIKGCVENGEKPDPSQKWEPYLEVMQTQIQEAEAAGIEVVVVGVGAGAQYVETLAPQHHVYAENFQDLPRAVVQRLSDMLLNLR